jgi:hypothetical protein
MKGLCLIEQNIFMLYYNKFIEGSYEKEKRTTEKTKIVIIWKFVLFEPFCSIQKYIFVHKNRTIFKTKIVIIWKFYCFNHSALIKNTLKHNSLLSTDFSGIAHFDTL